MRCSTAASRGVVGRWRRRALGLRALAIATLVFVVLDRPAAAAHQLAAALPPTWIEPAVAAARLGAVALLWITGAALLVLLAAPSRIGERWSPRR